MVDLAKLVANPIMIMASYALTALALIVAIYSYVRTRRISRLIYNRESVHRFGQKSTKFLSETAPQCVTTRVFYADGNSEREFEGARIDEINVANRGTEVILGANIIEADPLRIKSPSGSIIDYAILGRSNPANGVQVARKDGGDSELGVSFEFLNPGDGFAIRILHSSSKLIDLFGGVIGVEMRDASKDLGVGGRIGVLSALTLLLGTVGWGVIGAFYVFGWRIYSQKYAEVASAFCVVGIGGMYFGLFWLILSNRHIRNRFLSSSRRMMRLFPFRRPEE
ncbi:MAG TPA: hypothetical protein VNX86_15230 [Rhizomicrobium sp.]|jgi:hypothetical protein|nr:hypothetical protein [Rhizomicrobium sp.]